MDFQFKDSYRLNSKGRKVYSKENTKHKKGRVVILILDKVYFRTSNIITEKQGHFYDRRINLSQVHR